MAVPEGPERSHGEVHFFRPWPKFPSISITGTRCALMCKYCRGFYLKGMLHAEEPGELWELCSRLAKKGIRGVLISGGFTKDGVLPVRPFLKAIRAIKERLGLLVAIHPGLVDKELARELASAGVDVALFDVVGDERTIRDVIGLRKKPEDYLASLTALREAGIPVAPHVCLGIHGGELRGEEEALEMVRSVGADVLVIIVFMPTRGTPFQDASPPALEELRPVMAEARGMFKGIPVALGCMKPRMRPYRTALEAMALELGFDRMALPARETVDRARASGLKIVWHDVCCALP